MSPHPRDLTDAEAMRGMSRDRLRSVILDGVPGSSMSAWRNVLEEGQIHDVIEYIDRAFHPLPE